MHGRKASAELYRHHSGPPLPYMNCPGQGTNTGANADLLFFTLSDQPNYLDHYNNLHNGGTLHAAL
jgi:hypothetical protein